MAKIKFLTDSASDIPAELLQELGIEMVSFPIHTENSEELIYDRVSMSPRDFYKKLDQEKKIPTHAQITPFQFSEIFVQAWKDGYTHLIYTSINSKGSATYQNAKQQANSFFFENPAAKGKIEITVIDGRAYTLAYGYAVIQGARMAKEGKSPEEIICFITDWVNHARIIFVPYSLKFAKKSGRVSASAAFVGEALGFKPFMTFTEGNSEILAKVRGEKNIVSSLVELMAEDFQAGSPYFLISTGMDQEIAKLKTACVAEFKAEPEMISDVGGVIAINAGTAVLGVVYRAEDEEDPVEQWSWDYESARKKASATGVSQ